MSTSNINNLNDFPDEVLQNIFIRLNGNCICKNIILVCKRWRDIVENNYFWITKSELEKKNIEKATRYFQNFETLVAKKLYFKNPFERNLIKNPCGNDGFKDWCLTETQGDAQPIDLKDYYLKNKYNTIDAIDWSKEWPIQKNGWSIESEDVGCKPLNNENESIKRFVTSYYPAIKFQLIDLEEEGLTKDMIKNSTIRIRFSENFTNRNFCGLRYQLCVRLLNEKYEKIKEFVYNQEIDRSDDSEWHTVVDEFKISRENLRFIYYYHKGSDNIFWAGYYGAKITNSSVQLFF